MEAGHLVVQTQDLDEPQAQAFLEFVKLVSCKHHGVAGLHVCYPSYRSPLGVPQC